MIQFCPERFHSFVRIPVKVTAANTDESPPRSFKIALACHILFIALWTMPLIAIALDGDTSLHPLDNEIDTVSVIGRITNTHLCAHIKLFAVDYVKDITLKLGIKTIFFRFIDAPTGIEHVGE